ncbi:MAG: type II toxin-antitoxin system HicA family toxin [Candidatus Aminicenantales bacterium]
MKRKDIESRLRAAGWMFARRGGRHDIWRRDELELAVPRHREINEYTARAILEIAEGKRR